MISTYYESPFNTFERCPRTRVTEGAVFNVEVEMMYVYKPELVSSGGSEILHKPMYKARSEDETHERRL